MSSSIFGLMGIARDGLLAQEAGIDLTGQNISNVNTPGYVRRTPVFEVRATPDGSAGGVQVASFARSFDGLTFARVVQEQGRQGSAQTRSDALGQVQSILAPASGGIGDKMSALFASIQTMSANPSDLGTRSVVLSQASDLAVTFQRTASDLTTTRSDLLQKAQSAAGDANSALSEIAKLNIEIANAQGRGDNAADLRDRRDTLVRDLGTSVGARAIEDKSGMITVFAAGTTLVNGADAASVSVGLDASGAMAVKATRADGSVVDMTSSLSEGKMGGFRQARDVDIPASLAQVDTLAFNLATKLNTIHQAGFGLDGSTGRPLFTPPTGIAGTAYSLTVDAAMIDHPERIAAAGSAADVPGGNDNAVALGAVASQALGASSSPGVAVGAIEADIGARKSSSDQELSLRQDTVAQATSLNESSSGVSLDEETVNLTKYQRAFQASTKVLQTADALLDDLLKSL